MSASTLLTKVAACRQTFSRAPNEPFFTTKGLGRGTGLGLAMVDGFVKQSGGRLEFESCENVGTTIRLAFPLRTRPPLAPEHEDAFDGAVRDAGDRARRSNEIETILVVDDSAEALALAADYLSTLGYRILTAPDADVALQILSGEHVELLFTDLVMPGEMDGLKLAAEVERRWPHTAILLTTGYNEELVADGPPAPSMDVLGKPYRKSELAERVRIALNGVARPVREPPSPFPHHEG